MSIHSSNKQEALEAFDGKLIKRNSFGGVSFRMRDFANSLENNIERLSKLIESSNLHEKYYQTYLDIIQKTQNSLKENDEHLKNICAEDDIKDFDNREKFFESLKDSNWNKIYLNPDRLYKEKILTNMQRSREFGIQTRNIFFTTEKVIWSPPFLKPKDTMFFIKTETFSGKDSDYRKITDIICGNVFDSKLLKKDIPSQRIAYQNLIITNAQICYSNDTFHEIESDRFPFPLVHFLKEMILDLDDDVSFTRNLQNNKSNSLLQEVLLNSDILN